ncbi:protein kinase domain-containing protein [Colletotrichum orchidophilum]|uniref:Protein kinase domain-containing protein n=1 Tax=Colletotrichum orchidophilum TaxID=1209926 RepID=A0A1G4AVG3_9PEZI|nr:protein kinase domain-containing protein [Colletotrichum orchidophilum]OHE93157.1 protein kinase domain-containing protein [Colletotrichum orchidophilum]
MSDPWVSPRYNRESTATVVKFLETTLAKRRSLTDKERYELGDRYWDNEEPEEPYMAYEEGMLHPVKLGDQLLDGKYTVIHKLGSGSFSTVWLAHNAETDDKVAVKICVAKDEEFPAGDEAGISKLLSQNDYAHPGGIAIDCYERVFPHKGPNGIHECFVSSPMGVTLSESKFRSNGGWLFPTEVARALAAQLVLGVGYIHSKRIVHGDFHMGNVMLAIPDGELASLTVEEIYKKYGSPTILPMDLCVEHTDFHEEHPLPPNAPPYMLWKMHIRGGECETLRLSDAVVKIKDFGESWQPEFETRHELNIPEKYRAPEAMVAEKLKLPISYPADVWALGCMIFEVYAANDVFETYFPDYNGVWADMVMMMGKPQATWWDAWEDRKKYMDDQGRLLRDGQRRSENESDEEASQDELHTIEQRVLETIPEHRRTKQEEPNPENFVPQEELHDLAAMLKRIFHWLPEDRATAEELMNDPWMKKWGLPAKEAMDQAYQKRRMECEKPRYVAQPKADNSAVPEVTAAPKETVGFFESLARSFPYAWWQSLWKAFDI